jgi:hypothetical protein
MGKTRGGSEPQPPCLWCDHDVACKQVIVAVHDGRVDGCACRLRRSDLRLQVRQIKLFESKALCRVALKLERTGLLQPEPRQRRRATQGVVVLGKERRLYGPPKTPCRRQRLLGANSMCAASPRMGGTGEVRVSVPYHAYMVGKRVGSLGSSTLTEWNCCRRRAMREAKCGRGRSSGVNVFMLMNVSTLPF